MGAHLRKWRFDKNTMIRKFAAFVPVLTLVGASAFAAQAPATDTTTTTTEKKHAKKHAKKAKASKTTTTDTTAAPAKK